MYQTINRFTNRPKKMSTHYIPFKKDKKLQNHSFIPKVKKQNHYQENYKLTNKMIHYVIWFAVHKGLNLQV